MYIVNLIMNSWQRVGLTSLLMSGVMVGMGSPGYAITCNDVMEFSNTFIDSHLTHEKITPELMKLTLKNYIERWDPSKNYFLKADVEGFYNQYSDSLAELIAAADCSPIQQIADTFMQRLNETYQVINKLILAKHDFSVRETLMLDADYRDFSQTTVERTENWRKRIKYSYLQLLSTLSDKEARTRLAKRYELRLKDYNNYELGDVYVLFLKAFGAALDPHSDYFSADELKDFEISFQLSLEGIGVSISSLDGIVRINQVLPGGAADKQGELQIGDKILAVAQDSEEFVNVIDQNLNDVVKLIRGPRGTKVRLLVLRKESGQNLKKEITIIREKIDLVDLQVQHHRYRVFDPLQAKVHRIGVVIVPSFYSSQIGSRGRSNKKNRRSVAADVEVATEQLVAQGIDGLIVDLRNNGGGSLDEVVTMTGLFMPNGVVVQTKDKSIEVQSSRDFKVTYDGPMVVLVDMLSASASEIFAGALLAHNRALLVGDEHTFGKGTVQNQVLFATGKGALKVTASKFYSPAGYSTQKRGVPAQIVFPSLFKEYEIGEKFRETALPWDQIPPAKLLKLKRTTPEIITTLSQLSANRRRYDPQFLGLNKDILRVRENKVDGTPVSLRWKPDLDRLQEESDQSADEELGLSAQNQPVGFQPPKLSVDYRLKEALFIAADYAQLLSQGSSKFFKSTNSFMSPRSPTSPKSPTGHYQIFPQPEDIQGTCTLPISLGVSLGC